MHATLCQPQHNVPDEQQDKLIDLQNDSSAKDLLDYKTVEGFWIHIDRLES